MRFFKAWRLYANCKQNEENYYFNEIILILCNSYYLNNKELRQLGIEEKSELEILNIIKNNYKNANCTSIINYIKEIKNIKSDNMNFKNIIDLFIQLPIVKRNITSD